MKLIRAVALTLAVLLILAAPALGEAKPEPGTALDLALSLGYTVQVLPGDPNQSFLFIEGETTGDPAVTQFSIYFEDNGYRYRVDSSTESNRWPYLPRMIVLNNFMPLADFVRAGFIPYGSGKVYMYDPDRYWTEPDPVYFDTVEDFKRGVNGYFNALINPAADDEVIQEAP